MKILESLRSAGLTNEAIGAALAKQSGRQAPSAQRVHDWVSGQRPTPRWAHDAAADCLCSLWEMDRRAVHPDALAACDAKWATRLDPILGEMYSVMLYLPADVRAHLRSLKSAIRRVVSENLSVEIPGI
jgi:hypothetical protein